MATNLNYDPNKVTQPTTAIPLSTLKSSPTPIAVPPQTVVPPTTFMAPINNVSNDIIQSQANLAKQQQAVDTANTQGSSLASILSSLESGNVKDVAGTYAEQGVTPAFNQLQDLAVQAQGLQRESQAIPIQIQQGATGRGVTEAGVAPLQTAQLRENALKALSLGQQYAIAEGNYNKAKNYADQLIETKYSNEQARIQSLRTQLEALKDFNLTPAQEKLRQAQLNLTKKQDEEIADKKANDRAINDLMINASQVAPQDVLSRAKEIQDKGGSPTEVAMALGQYGGDYLKNQAYKSQLETDKASRANIYNQIATRNKELILKQKEFDEKKSLINFQAPPILNPDTGKVDPKSAITSIIKATGSKLKGGQSALDVLTSVQALAERNPQGTFPGLGIGSGLLMERFKSPQQQANRQDVEAIGLKVQQWASGASLTEKQTEMVKNFTPQPDDSDNAVKNKTNGLVNFMLQQVSSDLAGQGIAYNPEPVDLFSGIEGQSNESFLASIPSAPTDTKALFDNKTFFNR